jgi:hypothetical protein
MITLLNISHRRKTAEKNKSSSHSMVCNAISVTASSAVKLEKKGEH